MQKTWTFNGGAEGYGYADDTFRLTSKPGYASGVWAAGGGPDASGALRVSLGGIDNADVAGLSGGWSTNFSLSGTEDVQLTFRVNATQSNAYESNEYSEVLVASTAGCTASASGSPATATAAPSGAPAGARSRSTSASSRRASIG